MRSKLNILVSPVAYTVHHRMKFGAVAAMLGCCYSIASDRKNAFVVAVARRLNGDGFLITAYQTDGIKEGERLWLK